MPNITNYYETYYHRMQRQRRGTKKKINISMYLQDALGINEVPIINII